MRHVLIGLLSDTEPSGAFASLVVKGEALLIYEYMTNGSLDQHLFQKGSAQQHQEGMSLRQWHTRYGIARDIVTGLHYVHHEHEPMVLHRDIKASNIMLDSDFCARLGDFGIASTVAVNRSSVSGIAGTWGYIAPDYAMSYKATRKTDIYAFGECHRKEERGHPS